MISMNRNYRKFHSYLISLAFLVPVTIAFTVPKASIAQGNPPVMQGNAQVSMTLYQLKTNSDGSQFVVARDGSLVPLPPPGMAATDGKVAVYGDNKGNFWYQAPNGTAVPINDSRLTWKGNQTYAKQAKQSKKEQRRSRRRALLGSFLGAATGAAVSNYAYGNYNGVPYGYPMYGAPGSMYYMGPNGTPVYVNVDGDDLSKLYNQWTVQQQMVQQNRLQYQQQAHQNLLNTQQQAYQNHLNYQQQRSASHQAAQQNRLNNQQQAIENRQSWQQNHVDSRQSAVKNASTEKKNWRQKRAESFKNSSRKGWRNENRAAKAGVEKGKFGKRARSENSRFGRRFGKKSSGENSRFGAKSGASRFQNRSAGNRFKGRFTKTGDKFKKRRGH